MLWFGKNSSLRLRFGGGSLHVLYCGSQIHKNWRRRCDEINGDNFVRLVCHVRRSFVTSSVPILRFIRISRKALACLPVSLLASYADSQASWQNGQRFKLWRKQIPCCGQNVIKTGIHMLKKSYTFLIFKNFEEGNTKSRKIKVGKVKHCTALSAGF